MIVDDDFDDLFQIFPKFINQKLKKHNKKKDLVEVILDIGRRPEGRFLSGTEYLSKNLISWQDLYYCVKRIGSLNKENRAGIERTLHRVSCVKNQQGIIVGLTCRVGRNIIGSISIIRDLLELEKSLLILGKPGVGKTTTIREISRVLSEEMQKRVIIIDTSNEIAGDSNLFHPGIGKARRMQICPWDSQHQTMIEAVENHMPETIIVDEIGTELEALAARTIAEQGVQLIGTAHGNSLENLLKSPLLSDLLGGIQIVTLSDDEARKRKKQKSIQERKTKPSFEIAIEIHTKTIWTIHPKVEDSVDLLLEDKACVTQLRVWSQNKRQKIGSPLFDLNELIEEARSLESKNSLKKQKNLNENQEISRESLHFFTKDPFFYETIMPIEDNVKDQTSFLRQEVFCENLDFERTELENLFSKKRSFNKHKCDNSLYAGNDLSLLFSLYQLNTKLQRILLDIKKKKNILVNSLLKSKFLKQEAKSLCLKNFRTRCLLKKKEKKRQYLYICCLSNLPMKKICTCLGFFVVFTKKIHKADIVLTTKTYLLNNQRLQQVAKKRRLPIYAISPEIFGPFTKCLQHFLLYSSI